MENSSLIYAQASINSWLLDALLYVIRWLPSRLSFALGQIEYEAVIDFLKRREKSDSSQDRFVVGNKNISMAKESLTVQRESDERIVEEFLQRERENIKERFGFRRRGGSQAEYDLSQLGMRFEETYKMIEDAKKIYKNNSRDKRWREFVTKEYPSLPADLLERLSKTPNLPDEIWAKLSEKGGTSAASDIALEYAARLCNVPPYYYSIRHLRGVLSKQGMGVKKVKPKGQ